MAVFAVDRHKIFGLEKRVHKLELLGAGVARYVYLNGAIVEYADTVLDKLVDYSVDELFVAGNGA